PGGPVQGGWETAVLERAMARADARAAVGGSEWQRSRAAPRRRCPGRPWPTSPLLFRDALDDRVRIGPDQLNLVIRDDHKGQRFRMPGDELTGRRPRPRRVDRIHAREGLVD